MEVVAFAVASHGSSCPALGVEIVWCAVLGVMGGVGSGHSSFDVEGTVNGWAVTMWMREPQATIAMASSNRIITTVNCVAMHAVLRSARK